ncbi:MAG: TIGR01459 family HAD-type hydrolase [Pseudomonadota bacterium]
MIQFPDGLSALSERYEVVLCDVWGVIHNGRRAFDAACDALVRFRTEGGKVCLITNAPVPKAQVIRYFEPLGVPSEAFDDCVSSGDATREVLREQNEKTFWRLGGDEGWEHDRYLYEGLDLVFASEEDADMILGIGLEDQQNDEPEQYRERLSAAAHRGMTMICANPDKQVRVGDHLYWCAGALAEIFEQEGGEVLYPGKPHAPIYNLALKTLGVNRSAVDPKTVLCIGDSPTTDIRGAVHQGFDSLYVGTGLKQHGADFETEVRALLADNDTMAQWAMPQLEW